MFIISGAFPDGDTLISRPSTFVITKVFGKNTKQTITTSNTN